MEDILMEIIESAKVEALDELERDLEEVDVITDHLQDYDSEIDLDRDVPDGEIEVDSSDKPIVVDYLEEIIWLDSDTSHEILTPINNIKRENK